MKFVLFLPFFLISCKTHQVILDQGGELSYKETDFASSENQEPSSDITSIQKQLNSLERNFVHQKELDQSIGSLRQDIEELKVQVEELQKHVLADSQLEPKEAKPSLSLFDQAEKSFEEKKWKDAILTYEKFRTDEPSSPRFKEATLKIGKSFIELGYPKEAQVFFEEIVARFPRSKEAQEAQKLLNSKK